ncbi:MAG: enolase [Patescibacteria group bacterium]|nr:MAG: enolase [Patescibacteria group bacterium]
MTIAKIYAQEILDSRGNPTVEAKVTLEGGVSATASVPSGASTGSHEALELRDEKSDRYLGKDVMQAVENVNTWIAAELTGMEVTDQKAIDDKMIQLDGTETKSKLGANAILAVSMAVTKAAAASLEMPLYQYVARLFGNSETEFIIPIPMMNVLNGGRHAIGSTDMQEYMLMPVGAPNVEEAVRWGSEVFHVLGKMLQEKGFQITVGDEGGYAPSLKRNEEPFELMIAAIKEAGYKPGEEIAIAQDPAASEFYENGKYVFKTESRELTSTEMVALYTDWIEKYPIVSIEDGLAEDDWDGFVALNKAIGDRVQLVGDDLYVTNIKRLQKGIDLGAGNSILIKLNQIGTVTETIAAIKLAKENRMTAIVSHRSGETEDTFIADFVVGAGTGQIKTGSLSRSERVAKYNRLMRIERELGERAHYAQFPFTK